MIDIGDWEKPLKDLISSNYFYKLGQKINYLYDNEKVAPEKQNIFRAFKLCQFADLKIVILGQDPYHDFIGNKPRANGLAFANSDNSTTISPSLLNIYRELQNDLGKVPNFDVSLEKWAKQGVLLLNTALTVKKGNPNSHKLYWKEFTNEVIKQIVLQKPETLFILWGNNAKSYEKILENNSIHPNIIKSAHPSPFSYNKGFKNSKPFSKANKYLENKTKIKW